MFLFLSVLQQMYVFAGQPILVCPCVGVHWRTLLMSLSLFLQQCLACLVCLTWVVCEMGGKWLYGCCFVGCCLQDLFKTPHSILCTSHLTISPGVLSFFQVVQPFNSTNMSTSCKNSHFTLSKRSDFHMVVNLLIAVYT